MNSKSCLYRSIMIFMLSCQTNTIANPYYLLHNQLSYTNAELFCNQQCSSHLASIHSPIDYNYSLQIIRQNDMKNYLPNSDIFIGLNDIQSEGIYQWTDNSSFNFASNISIGGIYPWKSNSPNNANNIHGGQNCIKYSFYFNYLFDDTECNNNHKFLCNKCDTIINKYLIINKAMNYNQAQTYCIDNIGTNLAIIYSNNQYNEAIFLCSHSSQYSNNNECWIGSNSSFIQHKINANINIHNTYGIMLMKHEINLQLIDNERFFLCDMPSEIYYKQQWYIMNGYWNETNLMTVIYKNQWINTNGILVIEFTYKIIDIIENKDDNQGMVGILIFDEQNVCYSYYIGITYGINGGFYVFIAELSVYPENGINNMNIVQNVSLDVSIDESYLLRVEIINHMSYHILVNDIKYIVYNDSIDAIDNILSGYIGIYYSNLKIDIENLYISGSKIFVGNVIEFEDCEIEINETVNTRQKQITYGFLLSFFIICLAYCSAVMCICLVCPWREDNVIRRKLYGKTRDGLYNQLFA